MRPAAISSTGTFYQYLGGAFVMALAALAFETGKVTITGELVFALAWLVFVLSIGAIFLLMIMIRDGELSKVASHFYLVPAVTALIAWALFGEELTPVQIVGMAIAAFGVALATGRSPAHQRRGFRKVSNPSRGRAPLDSGLSRRSARRRG